ncbi:ribonuclease III [Peptoniphilus sp.]|jgi:ribonuclease-3|uniref:ribonuclease III n=1 Tax=Peptoniphilus sp. TaxID=1971214 RepID=UPI003D908C26
MAEKLDLFQEKIGYYFKNIDLLKTALTHSSYVNENKMHHYESNERLEFLGDAVLDLVIGEFLYLTFPKESEGYLSKIRSECVNEHVLSKISKEIGLGSLIYFGNGEIKNGGRFRESTSSDALEALIGAIYLDSSFKTCEEFVLKLFGSHINVSEIKTISRDYKTEIQEIAQKYGKICKYEIVKEEGPDNDKTFYCHLSIDDEIVGKGVGKTKKKATQMAAKAAMDDLEGNKNV